MKRFCTKSFIFGDLFLLLLFLLSFTNAYAQWAYTYGGSNGDFVTWVEQTADDGYIVAGYTESFGAGDHNAWIVKLDSSGNVLWQKTYGGTAFDYVMSVQQTADGGYVIAAGTASFGAGSYDVWVMKLDASGTIVWQKTYGGSGSENPYAITQTSDNGFIVACESNSFSVGNWDAWLIKLDSDGNIMWERTYGGTGDDVFYSLQQIEGDGYIVAGRTRSFDASDYDAWVLKLDEDGYVTWQKRYGGAARDSVFSIQQTSDGGYVVSGSTSSFNDGSQDAWAMKLDQNGAVLWEKIYGGNGPDGFSFIQQTQDGGYVTTGSTISGNGTPDVWVVKLDGNGGMSWQKTYGGSGNENAYMVHQTSDGGYIVGGDAYSFSNGHPDYFLLKLDSAGSVGSCPFEAISTAILSNTAATVVDTTAVPITSTATVANTTVTATDTTAYPAVICSSGDARLKVGLTKKRNGDGSITSHDDLIDCPDTCQAGYSLGFQVTLTATPFPFSTFLGWKPSSPGCEGTDTCTITMDKKKSIKAIFQGPNRLKVVTTMKNGALGSVVSGDGFINCPGDCDESYILNAPVTLTATAGTDSQFVKWTGNPCKTELSNVCTFTMEKNATVKAIFEPLD